MESVWQKMDVYIDVVWLYSDSKTYILICFLRNDRFKSKLKTSLALPLI